MFGAPLPPVDWSETPFAEVPLAENEVDSARTSLERLRGWGDESLMNSKELEQQRADQAQAMEEIRQLVRQEEKLLSVAGSLPTSMRVALKQAVANPNRITNTVMAGNRSMAMATPGAGWAATPGPGGGRRALAFPFTPGAFGALAPIAAPSLSVPPPSAPPPSAPSAAASSATGGVSSAPPPVGSGGGGGSGPVARAPTQSAKMTPGKKKNQPSKNQKLRARTGGARP